MYERIVVPLDGSELAERALPTAEELARLTGASLHLVRVVDLSRLERYGTYGLALEYAGATIVIEEEDKAARAYVARIAEGLTERDFTVTTEVPSGAAARELIALARPRDLIVMASHGRGGMARWFLGSVAEEVARRSPAPVLLLRSVPVPDEVLAADAEPATTATT